MLTVANKSDLKAAIPDRSASPYLARLYMKEGFGAIGYRCEVAGCVERGETQHIQISIRNDLSNLKRRVVALLYPTYETNNLFLAS